MTSVVLNELTRKEKLKLAQDKAWALMSLIEEHNLVRVGASEQEVADQIFELAKANFAITKHWHKKIVRAGINSVLNSKANPENRIIEENDLVYVDLGPVFEEFEGDVGKTYLLGDDCDKQRLVKDLDSIFKAGKAYYLEHPEVTGSQLYALIVELANKSGWAFGNDAAGHIVSEFSHVQMYGQDSQNRISSQNTTPMNAPDKNGNLRYWILEVHLVDKTGQYGGFFEDILF